MSQARVNSVPRVVWPVAHWFECQGVCLPPGWHRTEGAGKELTAKGFAKERG